MMAASLRCPWDKPDADLCFPAINLLWEATFEEFQPSTLAPNPGDHTSNGRSHHNIALPEGGDNFEPFLSGHRGD